MPLSGLWNRTEWSACTAIASSHLCQREYIPKCKNVKRKSTGVSDAVRRGPKCTQTRTASDAKRVRRTPPTSPVDFPKRPTSANRRQRPTSAKRGRRTSNASTTQASQAPSLRVQDISQDFENQYAQAQIVLKNGKQALQDAKLVSDEEAGR